MPNIRPAFPNLLPHVVADIGTEIEIAFLESLLRD
jgi:hypothetical protein